MLARPEHGRHAGMGLGLGSFGEMSRRQALAVTWDIHAKFVAVKPEYSTVY